MAIIVAVTTLFIISATSGVEKGINYLANLGAVATIALFVFFLVAGGSTVLVISQGIESIGTYVLQVIPTTLETGIGEEKWMASWTLFYWAWWISWAPFVGMFVARISRGRTIRELVLGVVLIALFFISGADAASVVTATMASRGSLEPPRLVVIVLGVLMGGIACAMLLVGGLAALQQAAILGSVPFAFVIVGVACWVKAAATPSAAPSAHRHHLRPRDRDDRQGRHTVSDQDNPRRAGDARRFAGVTDLISEATRIRSLGIHGIESVDPQIERRTRASAWAPTTDILAIGDDLVIRIELPGSTPRRSTCASPAASSPSRGRARTRRHRTRPPSSSASATSASSAGHSPCPRGRRRRRSPRSSPTGLVELTVRGGASGATGSRIPLVERTGSTSTTRPVTDGDAAG